MKQEDGRNGGGGGGFLPHARSNATAFTAARSGRLASRLPIVGQPSQHPSVSPPRFQSQRKTGMKIKTEESPTAMAMTPAGQMDSTDNPNTSSSSRAIITKLMADKAPELLPKIDVIEMLFQETRAIQTRGDQEKKDGHSHRAPASQAQKQRPAVGGSERSVSSKPTQAAPVTNRPPEAQPRPAGPNQENTNVSIDKVDKMYLAARPRKHRSETGQNPAAKRVKPSAPSPTVGQTGVTAPAPSSPTAAGDAGNQPNSPARPSQHMERSLLNNRNRLKELEDNLERDRFHLDAREMEYEIIQLRILISKLDCLLEAQLKYEEATDGQCELLTLSLARLSSGPGEDSSFGPLPRPSEFTRRQGQELWLKLRSLRIEAQSRNGKDIRRFVDELVRIEDLQYFVDNLEKKYRDYFAREERILKKRIKREEAGASSTGSSQHRRGEPTRPPPAVKEEATPPKPDSPLRAIKREY